MTARHLGVPELPPSLPSLPGPALPAARVALGPALPCPPLCLIVDRAATSTETRHTPL